jgi:hypothetical protein
MGHTTYEHFVECCVGEMLQTVAERATGMRRLGNKGAEKLVQAVIDERREANEESDD